VYRFQQLLFIVCTFVLNCLLPFRRIKLYILVIIMLNVFRLVLRLRRYERKLEIAVLLKDGAILAQNFTNPQTILCVVIITGWIYLLYGIRILAGVAFVFSQCTRLADKQTDERTVCSSKWLRLHSKPPAVREIHTQDPTISRLHVTKRLLHL